MPLFCLGGVGLPALQSLMTGKVDSRGQGRLQGVLAEFEDQPGLDRRPFVGDQRGLLCVAHDFSRFGVGRRRGALHVALTAGILQGESKNHELTERLIGVSGGASALISWRE